ncbi:ATP-dependent DNA helicase chl1 [Ascosphaera pollenicola]|nr:ATP-dependent DNA helicase chl1 [Ascosphaera pollenicola]
MAPSSPIDPLVKTYSMKTVPVSRHTMPIAGVQCDIYGLDELPSNAENVACVFLLHPRLGSRHNMEGMARLLISDWTQRLDAGSVSLARKDTGLIAVAFDQRNHGTRLVDQLANESWRGGNARHAQDMYATFQGTARDVSLLIDALPAYVFPRSDKQITTNMVLGVSLGAHASWSCILHDPRVTMAAIIIGTPDYGNLMADRARLSKLQTWTASTPPGSEFLGSESFPPSLVQWLERQDPAEMLLSHLSHPDAKLPARAASLPGPTEAEKNVIAPIVRRCLSGKQVILISGGADKLVPYAKGAPFLQWLKRGLSQDGWCADVDVVFEDMVVDGVGHEVTPEMYLEAVRFLGQSLAAGKEDKRQWVRDSRI